MVGSWGAVAAAVGVSYVMRRQRQSGQESVAACSSLGKKRAGMLTRTSSNSGRVQVQGVQNGGWVMMGSAGSAGLSGPAHDIVRG